MRTSTENSQSNMSNNKNANTVLYKNFNPDNIVFSDVKKNNHGGNIMYVNYKYPGESRPEKLVIQFPPIVSPFTYKPYVSTDGKVDHSINVSFGSNHITKDKMKTGFDKFYRNMVKFDEVIRKHVQQNSVAFLKKPSVSDDVIKAIHRSIVKPHVDKETGEETDEYPDTMKIKLQTDYNTEEVSTDFYKQYNNGDMEDATAEDVTGGTIIVPLVQCGTVYNVGGKFGVSWRMLQCAIRPKRTLAKRCIQLEDSSDEDEESVGSEPPSTNENPPQEPDNSPEESDSSSEDEEPEPKKTTKKRIIRRKK